MVGKSNLALFTEKELDIRRCSGSLLVCVKAKNYHTYTFVCISKYIFYIMPLSGNESGSDFQGNCYFTLRRIEPLKEITGLALKNLLQYPQMSPKTLLSLLSHMSWRCTEVKAHVCRNVVFWTLKKA